MLKLVAAIALAAGGHGGHGGGHAGASHGSVHVSVGRLSSTHAHATHAHVHFRGGYGGYGSYWTPYAPADDSDTSDDPSQPDETQVAPPPIDPNAASVGPEEPVVQVAPGTVSDAELPPKDQLVGWNKPKVLVIDPH